LVAYNPPAAQDREATLAATGIRASTKAYEAWLHDALGKDIVKTGLRAKHKKMAEGPFPFLRATYWRWAETILEICPELDDAPQVFAVGDIHVENFGTWRDVEGRLIWGVNDFDEAASMPFALDLVRLATSSVLGSGRLASTRAVCANILKGYERGLDDPRPIVLDHAYAWLRNLVVVPDQQRERFWTKLEALEPGRKSPPTRYRRCLAKAMPDRSLKMTIVPREAGAGSLGRPRWVAIADWRGGPVVREAKAALPSAWTLANGRGGRALHIYQVATGSFRAPDPWYAVEHNIVVRRLSPNNRKLDTEAHLFELLSTKMLRAMGRDLAAVHLGVDDQRKRIQHDLAKRKTGWLASAVKRAAKFIRREHKEWRRKFLRR
jgi:uncharacterized protein (DUF2252 family)